MSTNDTIYVACRSPAEAKFAERILEAFRAILDSTQGHGEITITVQSTERMTTASVRHVISYLDKLNL
jgi:hypothetical protein